MAKDITPNTIGNSNLHEISIALKLNKKVISINSWKIPGVITTKDWKEALNIFDNLGMEA